MGSINLTQVYITGPTKKSKEQKTEGTKGIMRIIYGIFFFARIIYGIYAGSLDRLVM